MIYNEIAKEVYIGKPERAKTNSPSNNHSTYKHNIHLAKLKQEIKIKHIEQEASKGEIMKEVVENEKIIQELEVNSCGKGKQKVMQKSLK